MKRFAIILMALALGLSVSAQRGRYNKGRKPVRTTQRVTPRPATTIKTCPDNNHPHAIDLGLPSGTKWACCNVGASKPEKYGSYFAWGETSSKTNYDEDTYKWYKKGEWIVDEELDEGYYDYSITKYCTDPKDGWNGFTDNKTILELADDAAHANWGGEWCMPDSTDFEELIEYTTNKWVKNFNGTGVKGCLFTGKNGKRIFLPAAGCRFGTMLCYTGSGYYRSNSLETDVPSCANNLILYPEDMHVGDDSIEDYIHTRALGFTVRPVCP